MESLNGIGLEGFAEHGFGGDKIRSLQELLKARSQSIKVCPTPNHKTNSLEQNNDVFVTLNTKLEEVLQDFVLEDFKGEITLTVDKRDCVSLKYVEQLARNGVRKKVIKLPGQDATLRKRNITEKGTEKGDLETEKGSPENKVYCLANSGLTGNKFVVEDVLQESTVVLRSRGSDNIKGTCDFKMRGAEREYRRLLGKPLNMKLRGTSFSESLNKDDERFAFGIGCSHVMGMTLMFFVGFYGFKVMTDSHEVYMLLGGLFAVVCWLFLEVVLCITRDHYIQMKTEKMRKHHDKFQ